MCESLNNIGTTSSISLVVPASLGAASLIQHISEMLFMYFLAQVGVQQAMDKGFDKQGVSMQFGQLL